MCLLGVYIRYVVGDERCGYGHQMADRGLEQALAIACRFPTGQETGTTQSGRDMMGVRNRVRSKIGVLDLPRRVGWDSMQYFSVHISDDSDEFGVAYDQTEADGSDFFYSPRTGQEVENWVEREFSLRDGMYSDYQASDLGLRLCSEYMKEVLDANRASGDDCQWLPARVASENETRQYFALHFPVSFDVIDERESLMGPGGVIKPVLKLEAVSHRSVFGIPDCCRRFVVSGRMMEAMVSSSLSGIAFSKVRAV